MCSPTGGMLMMVLRGLPQRMCHRRPQMALMRAGKKSSSLMIDFNPLYVPFQKESLPLRGQLGATRHVRRRSRSGMSISTPTSPTGAGVHSVQLLQNRTSHTEDYPLSFETFLCSPLTIATSVILEMKA